MISVLPKPVLHKHLYKLYVAGWLGLTSLYPVGRNIYEREWDALIVLDACRVDALREVAPEYDFIDNVEAVTSVGSTSHEWMAQTFREKYSDQISNTAYISSNAFTKRVLENRNFPADRLPLNWNTVQPRTFDLLDQAWEHQPDHPYKHMLSKHLTDRAITVGRDHSSGRMIIHYLQPHAPYISRAIEEDRELYDHELNPFDELQSGNIGRSDAWEMYLDDLRLCLDSIDLLLTNLDAEKVVITADHGEAFGEFGIYGHPTGCPHPVVKRVPWAETTASDRNEYEPEFRYGTESTTDTERQLRDLGYLE